MDSKTKPVTQRSPREYCTSSRVPFPIVTENVLYQLNQLNAVTFMPVPNSKQLIRIAPTTVSLTALRCKINETDLSPVCC